jgi:polyisoprenoid-binding protein YceI
MRSYIFLGAVGAVFILSAAPVDAVPTVADHTLSTVKPGAYTVEGDHTQVGFSVSHFGFTTYSGLFSGATGTLQLNPAQVANSTLNVTIQLESLVTTVPALTHELTGREWFDTEKFPSARFQSTNVVATADGVRIAGNLTLHGVTKPVVLHAKFVGAGVNPIDKAYTVGFQATGTINRSDFGVSAYVPAVGDEVVLTIAAAFVRRGQ